MKNIWYVVILILVLTLSGCDNSPEPITKIDDIIEDSRVENLASFNILLDEFELALDNDVAIQVNQIIEITDLGPDDYLLKSDVTIRSEMLYAEELDYLYVNSSANLSTEYGSVHGFAEVEFKEIDGELFLLEKSNGGFYTVKLDNNKDIHDYLSLFLTENDLNITSDVLVEKINNSTYSFTLQKENMGNIDFFEDLYAIDFSKFESITVTYSFTDTTIEMDYNLTGIRYENNQKTTDFHVNFTMKSLSTLTQKNMTLGGSCYVMSKSLDSTKLTFSHNTEIEICNRIGDNYLAVTLQPGSYIFSQEFESNQPDRVVDSEGTVIWEPSTTKINDFLIIDEYQTVYIVENYSSLISARTVRIQKVYDTVVVKNNLDLSSGSITSAIESENDYNHYNFLPSDADRILHVTVTSSTVPDYKTTRVFISSNIGGCNINNCVDTLFYIPKEVELKITTYGNRIGEFTFTYFTEDTGVLSHDFNTPTDIEIYNDLSYAVLDGNENLYMSFVITETGNYKVLNNTVAPTFDRYNMNLYDSDGTLLVEDWKTYTQLEPGTYRLEYIKGMISIFLPEIDKE